MVKNVQFMRALAAYGVVVHHIIFMLNDYILPSAQIAQRIAFNMGAFGVDLFFVISGFVMAETTNRDRLNPLIYAGHRVARIAPTYWLFTLLAALAILAGFQVFGGHAVTFGSLAESLLFIPQFDAGGKPLLPIVFVGWSLNYEMFFYALVTLALLVPMRALRWPLIWAVLIGLVGLAMHTRNPLLNYWGQPKVLEFALGAGVWFAMKKLRAPPAIAWLGIAAAITALIIAQIANPGGADPIAVWMASAATLLACALSLEKRGIKADWRWAQFQGDASYSVYLIHPFILQIMAKLAVASGLAFSFAGRIGAVALMFAAVALCASLFYRWVEKPVTKWTRRMVDKLGKRTAPAAAKAEAPALP